MPIRIRTNGHTVTKRSISGSGGHSSQEVEDRFIIIRICRVGFCRAMLHAISVAYMPSCGVGVSVCLSCCRVLCRNRRPVPF